MSNPPVGRPGANEYAAEFGKYIELVPDGDILSLLTSQLAELLKLLSGLSAQQSLVHHAPYTWSIRQVVGHMSDCERVFGYRALRFARNDTTPLATFDETAFMQAANFDRWPLEELLREFEHVRRSNLLLLAHLEPQAWQRAGVALDHPATVRAMAYVMAGHVKHHLDILRRRLGA